MWALVYINDLNHPKSACQGYSRCPVLHSPIKENRVSQLEQSPHQVVLRESSHGSEMTLSVHSSEFLGASGLPHVWGSWVGDPFGHGEEVAQMVLPIPAGPRPLRKFQKRHSNGGVP